MYTKIALFFTICCFVFTNGQDLDLPEGRPCKWENLTGTCADARKCTTFIVDLEEKNHPPICSFQGKYAIICCTACVIKEKIDPAPPPLPRLLAKCQEYYARLPYACRPGRIVPTNEKKLNKEGTCYHHYQSLVAPVGGQNTLRNQHPHMALLGFGSSRETAQWLCAGSVISDRFLLTAAHCASQPQLGPVTFVGLGMLKRTDPAEFWQVYRVKRFIPHPRYSSPLKYDDIAIIEIDQPIKFDKTVLPACVGESDLNTARNINYTIGHALGWGGLGHRKENADTLQVVTLEKFSTAECSKLYPRHRHLPRGFDPTTQVCYGSHEGIRDTCPGDSGGPIIRKVNGLSCSAHIFGITSYGQDCGFEGNAGIYTRVEAYEPWIEEVLFS